MSNSNLRQFRDYAGAFSNENSLPPGGEPPDNRGMELTERVAHLETDIKDVRDRLARIESTMATKDELRIMRAETKADIADLKADLKTEMHKQHIDIQRWMIATVIGLFLGFGGLFLAMSNALKAPAAQPVQQAAAPIVIQVPAPTPVK